MEDAFHFTFPKISDSLFKMIPEDRHNVCLNPLGPFGDSWIQYVGGYKGAADILVDNITDDRSSPDFLCFPIIFLYRHFLELLLKITIRYGYQLLHINKDFCATHNIITLWKECRKIIEIIGETFPDERRTDHLDATEKLLEEFSRIDPSSYETRYPESKDGTPTVEGIEYLNLKNMRSIIRSINNYLGSTCDAIFIGLSELPVIEP